MPHFVRMAYDTRAVLAQYLSPVRVRVWSAAATLSSPLVVQVTQERSHLAFQLPLTLRDQCAAPRSFSAVEVLPLVRPPGSRIRPLYSYSLSNTNTSVSGHVMCSASGSVSGCV